MNKTRFSSAIQKSATTKNERMIALAADMGATQDAVVTPDPAAGAQGVYSPPTKEQMSAKVVTALQELATSIGGTFKGNCLKKDYNGYELCIKYLGSGGSTHELELSFSVSSKSQKIFETKSIGYLGSNEKFNVPLNALRDAIRIGESAYSHGFDLAQDSLVALTMIKLDLSKATGAKGIY
jgi:hypothetical protein